MEDYNASVDIGVAVEENPSNKSPSPKPTGKKRRRKRSSSDASSQFEVTAKSDVAMTGTEAINALPSRQRISISSDDEDRNDGQISIGKKKKRKKKKKKKNDVSEIDRTSFKNNSNTEDEKKKEEKFPSLAPLKGMFIKERSNLPVYQHRYEICRLVSNNDVVLVVAETVSTFSHICF